jgi:multiple sugar transport system substrate-binding protein
MIGTFGDGDSERRGKGWWAKVISRRRFLGGLGGSIAASAAASLPGCLREPDDGRIHLRYMAWGSPEQHATEQEVIDRFNERNPDIRVRLFKVPNNAYRHKMILMLASRTAPDVIRVDQYDFPQLVRRDYFKDLTDFAAGDPSFDLSDFLPRSRSAGTKGVSTA